jgi:hypothetical protein
MGPLARWASWAVPVVLVLAAVVVAGASPGASTSPASGAPSHFETFTGGPVIVVTPTQGPSNGTLTVDGSGFTASGLANVTFAGVTIDPTGGSDCSYLGSDITVDSSGDFSCTFLVPSVPTIPTDPGSYNVTGNIEIPFTESNSVVFNVTVPAITVVPLQGPAGSTFTVTGVNFSVGSLANVTFAGTPLVPTGGSDCSFTAPNPNITTDASGGFNCTFAALAEPTGLAYSITAEDLSSASFSNSESFSETSPAISVVPGQGPKGAAVTVSGTGFSVSEALASLEFDSVPISICSTGSLTTDSSGAFSCGLSVPAGTSGDSVVATDAGGATATGFFNVTTPALTVAPSQGPIGSSVVVKGTGFSVSTPLASLSFDSVTISSCSTGSLTTNGTGGFSCKFAVPPGTSGTTVRAYDAGGQSAVQSFTVTTPAITATPVQGPQGATVTVAGTGFTISAPLASLVFDGVTISSCSSGVLTTDSSGAFSCLFAVPSGTSGTTVRATDTGGQVADATFTVTTPAINVAPGHGPVGSPVTISGTGFSVSTPLASLSFDGLMISSCPIRGSLTTTATGMFSCSIAVPSGTSGTTVRATDVGGQFATGSFQVTTEAITIAPSMGPVGATFQVTATGFTASASAKVTFNSATVSPIGCTVGSVSGSEVTTSSGGNFTCAFAVPTSVPGPFAVVATDLTTMTTSNSETFTVTVPTLAALPGQGPIGSALSVSGSGFTVSSTAQVEFSGTPLTAVSCTVGSNSGDTITTNSTGAFVCSFDVPTEGPSSYPVVATDLATSTPTNTVTFTVTAVAVNVAPGQGPVGTPVTISGTGYSVLTTVSSLVFDMVTISSCSSGSLTTGATGAFSCGIDVPVGTSGSSVVATDIGGQAGTAQFSVTVPAILVSPNSGPIGSMFGVSGTGFESGSALTVSVAGVSLTPTSCSTGTYAGASITTNGIGAFGCTFLLATQPGGSITLTATQGINSATVTFLINSSFSVSTPTGTVGGVLSFTGAGFAASSGFVVEWNATTPLCTGTTSAVGELSCSGTVPAAPAGPHTLTAVQGANSASASLTVTPAITLSVPSGAVGSTVTVTGTGFDAGTSFIVTWQGSSTVCSGSTNTNGGFSCTFAVPSTAVGPATIMVSEGSYSPTVTFTVSAAPPPPSGAPAFPWWIVAVIALVVVFLLVLGLVYQHRRHHRSTSAPPRGFGPTGSPHAWDEGSMIPGGGGAPSPLEPDLADAMGAGAVAGTVPAGAVGASSPTEANSEDIDALIARLERMSVQMFNKTPKQLSESSIAEAPASEAGDASDK